MGIAHKLVPDLGLTVVMWHGHITAEDSIRHLVGLAADPSWPPGLRHITDMRTAKTVTLPDPELLELLFEGSPWRDEDLEKVVIVSGELLRTTTVADAAAALGMNAVVFGDVTSACARLKVDPTTVDDILNQLRSEIEDRTRPQ
jgi:hypothetical protein